MASTIEMININNKKIPVVFEKHKTLPIFNLQLVFQNSGYILDGKKSGLTSLSAKVLNEGTLKDGAIKFARKLENKAISISTSSGFETFVIEVSCLKSEYKTALKYLEELLSNPNITKDTLDKLKKLQISKLTQKQNDFDYLAKVQLKKIIFKGTTLENSSSGTIKSIEKIKVKDIEKNLNTILNIDNLIIVAGGDITIDEINKAITPIIKTLNSSGKTKLQTVNIAKKIETKIKFKDTKQAYIYFGSNFNIDVKDEDSYKANVASFILGGSGFGSRLMEEIRVKRGLAYSAYGYVAMQKSHTYFTGYLQTKVENQEKAKKLVIKLVKEFVDKGVTAKELESAKKFLLGSQPLRTEIFAQRQSRAFHLYYKGQSQDYPKKELKLIEDLKLSDLNKFIKQHKEMTELSFSIITKQKDAK